MVIMKKNVLSYTTSWINRNFRIKVYGRDENGKRINKLVGVSGILKLIGAELFNKFIKRAVDCMMDSCVRAVSHILFILLPYPRFWQVWGWMMKPSLADCFTTL
jgi:hypothetical protein